MRFDRACTSTRMGLAHRIASIAAAIAICAVLACAAGCSSSGSGGSASSGTSSQTAASTPIEVDSVYGYFDSAAAQTMQNVSIDASHPERGYVGIECDASGVYKVQITMDGTTYTYDLPSDGTPHFYPLQMGDGQYTVTALRNVEGDKYAKVNTVTLDCTLTNEFQPYLHSNIFVNYNESSACVAKAKEITKNASTDTDKVSAIYDYLSSNIAYDYDLADTVQSGYIPDPDATLQSGKGICFDYASTAAAMIRSLGIPCKLITGYVAPDDLYHSWNMIYVQDQGWISVEVAANQNQWGRIDITYQATGGDAQFVGDGTNYVDRYTY